ncbi:plasmid stabilization protein [Beijerinckia sp. L45]|uniref:FitA-like ribbon-helix-helix domain-containing protein n=1 Tax=Beijerinckia sp. L45 TaxID=1641855 RepID=UPI00131ACCEE|nr:plasmid stabilization protein [Beijerinckia sp. L45]
MATVTIRNLDEKFETRLRLRADRYGRSVEDEARKILQAALGPDDDNQNLAEAIHSRFARLGGVDLEPIERTPMPDPIDFGE